MKSIPNPVFIIGKESLVSHDLIMRKDPYRIVIINYDLTDVLQYKCFGIKSLFKNV